MILINILIKIFVHLLSDIIINSFFGFITFANAVSEIVRIQKFTNGDDSKSIKKIINNLIGSYDSFLEKEGEGLRSFREGI